jgi:DNA-binding MarR family transcriptional regulator
MGLSNREEYLLYFYLQHYRDKRTARAAAAEQQVSRQYVSKLLAELEADGLVHVKRKSGGDVVDLTDAGERLIFPYIDCIEDIAISICEDRGTTAIRARMQAFRMICGIPEDTMAYIAASFVFSRVLRRAGGYPSNGVLCGLDAGVYNASAHFYRKGSRVESMGNLGLCQPARLVVSRGISGLELETRTFWYRRKLDGKLLRGALKRLRYRFDGKWTEAAGSHDRWVIPGAAIRAGRKDAGLHGAVRVCVKATCEHMPESEADLYISVRKGDRIF